MPQSAVRGRQRLSVLLLCDDRPSHAPNVLEHIRAFRRFSRHRVDVFNPCGLSRSRLLRLADYDAVVVHYTIFVLSDSYLAPWFREQVADFGGLKIQFIQDEYRQVNAVAGRAQELGIDVLFSSVPAEAVPSVYGERMPGVDVLSTLTGYVPSELERRPRAPVTGRPLDVVYRGRAIPYWLGRLGQEKVVIGREFLARASSTDLRCDIAWTEADRIYGEDWYRFLGSSRTTLGTESGASIVDFDGSLQERTETYLKAHPAALFDEVENEILAPHEGNAVIQTISPRVFESAALGTAMVNFTGRYSDIIEPWVHYVPLEKNFSNFEDVIAAIKDDGVLGPIAARAHSDLVASGSYSLERFVRTFDDEVASRVLPAQRRPRPRSVQAAARALRTVEQLGSPSRRAEVPVVATVRTRAVERAGNELMSRFPEIEALGGEAAAGVGPGERLRDDLVRLAAAAAAHIRELRYLGPPFDVRLELDADGRRLTLVSTLEASQDAGERAALRQRVATAIGERRLEEIVWNHSAVGTALTLNPLSGGSLEIGYHVVAGAYRFTALAELARHDPDRVATALEPLFRARPPVAVYELHGLLLTLMRVWSTPGRVAVRGAAAVRAALTWRELRRLLAAYLGSAEARQEAPLDLVLDDLLMLSLAGQAGANLEFNGETNVLTYRTESDAADGAALNADAVALLERIVWNHSAVDASVRSLTHPRVVLQLENGQHEFRALTLIARRFPAVALPALERAARGR